MFPLAGQTARTELAEIKKEKNIFTGNAGPFSLLIICP